MTHTPPQTALFRRARDILLETRTDLDRARREFSWPVFDEFNWAIDWFDVVATEQDRPALQIVEEDGSRASYTYSELSLRSNSVANFLRQLGVGKGSVVVLMLGNQLELWESILAAMKLGATLVPTSTLCTAADLADRITRSGASVVITSPSNTSKLFGTTGLTLIVTGDDVPGWISYATAYQAPREFVPTAPTRASDPLLYYFTSGTTAKPKLVEHTYTSYPIGHLSTLYWIGLRPGDVHMNVSSPGWAKHAWSSVFAPWNAEATILVYNYARFDARQLLDVVANSSTTTFCAPPTVWRMLIQEDLSSWAVQLREATSAGEPLNPEVIDAVMRSWGITIRDGFGQTETTAVIGNPPGQTVKLGSMGRVLPGYGISMIDPETGEEGEEGEICIREDPRPLGLMVGYRDGIASNENRSDYHHTGDLASRDEDGYVTYIGRSDDVFKASDYRISPFELESVLIEHQAVAEAAVVPAPDPIRLAVPKAYVFLAEGHEPSQETARSIFVHCRSALSPYKRVRRIEFSELPKTISGKIRRVELRAAEQDRTERGPNEYFEDDFPDLRN